MTPDKEPKETFELSLKRLEQIVNDLERGDLPLEESLARYEEGRERLKRCYNLLEEAEKKIVLLTKAEDGSIQEVPFDSTSTVKMHETKNKTKP